MEDSSLQSFDTFTIWYYSLICISACLVCDVAARMGHRCRHVTDLQRVQDCGRTNGELMSLSGITHQWRILW